MTIEEEFLDELREQTRWLRLLGTQALRPLIHEHLKTDRQRVVYELSDGHHSVREISAASGVGTTTVSRWWQEWLAAGICLEVATRAGRAEHLASLAQLGLAPAGSADDNRSDGSKEAGEG